MMNRKELSIWVRFSLMAVAIITAVQAHGQEAPTAPPMVQAWPVDTAQEVAVDDSLEVQWARGPGQAVSYGIQDIVVLRGDPHRCTDQTVPKDVRITLKILATTNPDHGDYQAAQDEDSAIVRTFEIGVRPKGGQPSGLSRDLDLKAADTWSLRDAHRMLLVVHNVEVNNGAGYAEVDEIPEEVFFDLSIAWSRVYSGLGLNQSPSGLAAAYVDCNGELTANEAEAKELQFTWNTLAGMVEYQLEWTWVDDYDISGAPFNSPAELDALKYDLGRNATRISTAETNYTIPLLYDRGYIVFRVRGVGVDPNGTLLPIYTAWTSLPVQGSVGDALDDDLAVHVPGHQKKKNWQASLSYAEEGKRKEVVTYADGTSRAREVVTRINSLKVPIIAQTIYDAVGRPALQMMPAPLVEPPCGGTGVTTAPIDFVPQFNRDNEPGDITSVDIHLSGDCDVNAPVMSSASGVEHYYSPAFANSTNSLLEAPAFLPRSEGYPYSQTQYTRDNSGKVRSQGGPGPTFQLGTGHEAKYLYGKPEQMQLDRMFGSEAGYALHYQKNVQTDANGQVSVMYLDMAGRTVATSLVGTPADPVRMEAVGEGGVELTTDLFDGLPSTDPALGQAGMPGPQLQFTTTVVVPSNGDYRFDYRVVPLVLQNECWENNGTAICAHCVYDLNIRMVDQCGEEIFEVKALVGTLDLDHGSVMFSCAPQAEYQAQFEDQPYALTAGEYTLTKTLSAHAAARDFYVDAFLKPENNDCVLSFQEIYDQLALEVDPSECHLDCTDCYDALGTLENYLATNEGATEETYQMQLAACDEMCMEPSWCSVAYKNMLGDVDLYGQYGQVEVNEDQQYVATDRTSVFYTGEGSSVLGIPYFNSSSTDPGRLADQNKPLWRQPWLVEDGVGSPVYKDLDGGRPKVYLTEISPGVFAQAVDDPASIEFDTNVGLYFTYPEHLLELDDFLHEWASGFERSLVRFHPEYCYYENCKGYAVRSDPDDRRTSSDGYDNELRMAQTFEDAVGEFDFLDEVNGAPLDPVEVNILAQDPFFQMLGPDDEYAQELTDKYDVYIQLGGINYSMPEAAAIFSRCAGSPTDTWCSGFGDRHLFDGDENPLTQEQVDQINDNEWASLRGFYLSEKYKVQKKRADAYVSECDCAGVNYCIGEENTSTWYDKTHSPFVYPFEYWNFSWDFEDWWNAYIQAWNLQLSHQSCQVCNDWNYQWFSLKTPRVAEPSQMPGMDMSPMEAAYQGFMQTGQCPMATAWQLMFQEMVQNGQLPSAQDVDLGNSAGWQTVQLALTDYEDDGAPPATFDAQPVGNNVQIDLEVGGDPYCTIILTPPSGFSWENVVYVAQLNAGSGSSFTLEVYYDQDGTMVPTSIAGTMCGAYSLSPCNFPHICEPTDLAIAMEGLFNMLALADLIGSQTAEDLEGATFANGPSDIQSALGPAIMSRFSPSPPPSLQWSFAPSVPAMFLSNVDHPLEKYRLDNLSTEPADQTLGWYLDNAVLFEGLNGEEGNFFSVRLLDANAELLCTLHGQSWWQDEDGSIPVSMGDCGLPASMACDNPTYWTYEELEDVITDALVSNASDLSDVDLWESPYMSAPLAVAICPQCDAAGDPPAGGIGLTGQYNTTTDVLTFGECLTVDLNFTGNGQFDAVGPFVPPSGEDAANTIYTANLYAGANVAGTVSFMAPCMDLVPCPDCPPPTSSAAAFGNGTDSSLQAMGLVKSDTIWSVYAAYLLSVDSLNDRLGLAPGDSGHVEVLPYAYYRQHGLERSTATYRRFLRNYQAAIDPQEHLAHMDTFVVDYGNAVNVEAEYGRYQAAVEEYDARATAAGKPPAPAPVPDSLFTYRLYAGQAASYVTYLAGHTPSNQPPLGLEAYLNGDSTVDGFCESLYKEHYLPAYDGMLAESGMDSARCPEFELYTPRLSYEEFLASNLCGSDSGLALLEAYLAKFTTDSLPCPGDLPRLVPATGTMQLATVELDQGTECQRLYTLWERKQTAYTASAYRAATEIEIGIGPGGYLAFAFDGACACAQEYIGYLEPYLLWAPGDAPLPELVGLRTYCGKDARGDLYFTALQGRVAAVNGSTYHAVTGLNVALPYATWTDMRRAGDGDLLNDYTAYLGTYVAWKAGDALPDPVLGIAAYKTTPQSSCCTLFAAYEEVLDDLEGSAYMSAHGCENPKRISSCQVMVAGGQCACVEEYIAYIQAYLAWQPGSGDLPVPCPMNINMYCNASGDLACSGAYTRYLLGITALQPLVSAYNVEHGTAYTFTVPVESLFNSTGLCYCVDGYLANLWAAFNDPDNGLPNSLQTPTPPPTADPLAQAGYWSIERYCELPVPCGPNPLPPLIPEIPFSEPDPCEQAQLAGLQINAQTLYDQQIDTLTHQIEALYDSVCLSTLEQFTMNFPDKEFHYTLYYYDQAGNLVRTVPPEGVRLVPIDSPQDPEAVLIAQDRQQGSHTFFTSHGMSSNQAFNSLGQPVGSSMPDQDNMADWSTTLPNGLPNWLQVTGSWFGSGGLGYLTGQRVVGSEKRGYLYATTDGGSTWSRSNGLVASDLYDVDHPTASVGYAVGNDGTVLRTADGGSNWRLLTGDLLGSGNHLRGVSFGSASTGVVVGEGGKFSFTSNSGNSFTTSALASVSAFSGVGRTSSSYIACGVGTATAPNTPPNGVLVPITSGGVAQAPVLTGATAADITCLSAWSDLYLVAGGSGGVLMHSIDKGETWATRTTGTTESFRSLVFLDAEKGVAIMDSANTDIGVLRLSLDGGATWAAAGRPWHDLNALVNVQGSNTEMLAVGKNGQVVRVIVGPNHISTIDVEGIPSGTTLKSAWAGKDGEAIRCIVGSQGDATIRYCADLAGAASWQTVTGQMGSGTTAKAIAASVRPGNLVIGAVLSSDGTLLDGRWDFNGSMPPEILPVSSQPPIATLIQKGNDQAVLGVQSNGELRKLSLTAHPMAAPTTPWGAPPPGLPTFAAGVAAVAGNRVVLAGAAGALHRADPPQTPVWSDRSTKVQPLPLNAMEGGAGFAAGDQGTFYMGSGTNWKAVPTPVVQDLNGLVLAGPNELILVGDSGTCFSVDPADPANSYHPFNLPLDLNIRSVAVQGNSMTLGAEAGTVFYTADRNIPAPLFTTLEDNSAGAIRALGLNASNGITAVGDHALVHRLQGTTRMPVLDVFPPTLWAVHSAAGSDVYAVGDALVARHSTDGGLTWNVVPHTPKTQWPAFKAVHASAPGQAWAVGEQGLAATFQEEVWTEQTGYSSTYDLTAIARAASGAMVITAKGATNGRLYLPNGNTPPPSVASPKALYAAWCFPVFGDH
jgi:photosystem II stability/assembly factor-like uncharacterized protein